MLQNNYQWIYYKQTKNLKLKTLSEKDSITSGLQSL